MSLILRKIIREAFSSKESRRSAPENGTTSRHKFFSGFYRCKKKMSKNQNALKLVGFKPAQLFTGSSWRVEYSVINPGTGNMVRKRIKINKIKSIKERRKYADRLIVELNKKLYKGWNPFLENEAAKSFIKIVDVLNTFMKAKERELKPNTIRSYKSTIKIFKEWLFENDLIDIYCSYFTDKMAMELMNHLYVDNGINERTYNNYRRTFKVVFNWMIDYRYLSRNPFDAIKKKRVRQKQRVIIPAELRQRIKVYLKGNDQKMYMASLLVYHCLIRPNEITFLKPVDFNLVNQTIFIASEAAKNSNARIATIPNSIINEIEGFNFFGADPDQYIYGENFQPGKKRLNPRRFSKKWTKLRKDLDIEMKYQFYSLRDSGIVQMLTDGVPPQEVMKQADHSSLEITSIYAKHANPKGSHLIKKLVSEF